MATIKKGNHRLKDDNEEIIVHVADNCEKDEYLHTWNRLDFDDYEAICRQKEMLGINAAINFRGVKPSVWLERLTGIRFDEFERKRNYLINQEDLFSKEKTNSCIVQMLVF